jgi:hypothetical protein
MTYTLTPEQMSLLSLARTAWRKRASVKRHRIFFGEESITETILLDLADTFPGRVFILPFNKRREGDIGADWAWAFVSADGRHNLPMLIQAKLLDLSDIEYPEIKRTIGKRKPPRRQIDQLIETAGKLRFPALYAFYNHLTISARVPATCQSLQMSGISPMPESWGISIADAYQVRSLLDDQSFDTHCRHSIALHCLLCSSGRGSRPLLGSPGLALAALQGLRRSLSRDRGMRPDRDGGPPSLPDEPLRQLPHIFRLARQVVNIEDPDERDLEESRIAQEYPELAGVLLLQDGE